MQRISVLQSSMASVPMDLGALDHDFKSVVSSPLNIETDDTLRTRTENFKHLTRLEGMIPAYIATVAEVVRRRLFTTLLQAYAESMSGSLVAVMSRERTRRLDYRAGFAGKLPWEIRGLGVGTEEDLPRLGVVRGSGNEELPDLDRAALESTSSLLGRSHPLLPPYLICQRRRDSTADSYPQLYRTTSFESKRR